MDDFSAVVLSEIDTLLVTEVYSAGEAPICGADGRALCAPRHPSARGQVDPVFVPDAAQARESPQGDFETERRAAHARRRQHRRRGGGAGAGTG